MVIEDIEPLNDEDPGVVPASITAVSDVDRNLPFTTLGEGDNKVKGRLASDLLPIRCALSVVELG
jgi:hypothetical protein